MSLRENPQFSVNRPELKALFARLGGADSGEENLGRILSDFYQRMANDVMLGFFFEGKDLEAIAGKQREFLMRAMGARPTYSGKSPATAHLGLPPILRGHFDRRLKLLEETLVEHGLGPDDVRTWLNFEKAFRDSVQA